MASEVRVNSITNRSGLGTATFNNDGSITLGGNLNLNSVTTTGRNAGVGTATGAMIFNTTRGTSQVYTGSTDGWVDFGDNSVFSATGGTLDTTSRSGYNIHTFTDPGTFTVNSGSKTVEYLVIAGGGGGGRGNPNVYGGGGGGAGGYRTGTTLVTQGDYPVVRGAGGAKAPAANTKGSPGTDSSFGTIVSTGGGYGAASFRTDGDSIGGPGGSGGGGGNYGSPPYPGQPGGTGNTPPTSPPQGNPGGRAVDGAANGSGGGGGASGAGGDGSSGQGGDGGNGSASSITGTSVTRAGGGGAAGSPAGGAGGPGGGGAGGRWPGVNATAATEYTGSGGGGGADPASDASAGASGIVIIAYPTA